MEFTKVECVLLGVPRVTSHLPLFFTEIIVIGALFPFRVFFSEVFTHFSFLVIFIKEMYKLATAALVFVSAAA